MTIKAHYDGKVLVPDEPVNLQKDQQVELDIRPVPAEQRKYMTGADLVQWINEHPELTRQWEEIAAGRDSVEVARDLRRQASRRGRMNDSD